MGDVLRRGEDGAIVSVEVGFEEIPGGPGGRGLRVEPDVTAPDGHQGNNAAELSGDGERLRIVHRDDIARLQQLAQALGIRAIDPLIESAVGFTQLRGADSVNEVVDPLGGLEERGLGTADHHPLHLHAESRNSDTMGGSISATPPPLAVEPHHPYGSSGQSRHDAGRLQAKLGHCRREVGDSGVVVHRLPRLDRDPHQRWPGCGGHRPGTSTAAPYRRPLRRLSSASFASASGRGDAATVRVGDQPGAEEFLAVSPREIGDRAHDPLPPEQIVGEGRDRAHVNPGADNRPAFHHRG